MSIEESLVIYKNRLGFRALLPFGLKFLENGEQEEEGTYLKKNVGRRGNLCNPLENGSLRFIFGWEGTGLAWKK